MTSTELPPNAIAVIGMAGRFPGAESVSAFWDNLRRGEESIVTLSEDELRAAGVSDKALMDPGYVRRAALMKGIDEFDADFFGMTPQAARTMDPQQRLFLQSSYHALEDAGYDPADIEGSVGVFATSTTSGYLLHNLMSQYDPHAIIGEGVTFQMVNLSLQNDKDYLATRVAYQLNLRGPALSVQTACSSSLVAVHLACQSILNGESDMALAGGASLRVPHDVGYWYAAGSMVSATGQCRPFDVRADGTIFGSGVGVVVLKSLEAAIEDGDRVHAVIRGSALNNDGATKMTYAAPNAAGQADVVAEAHAVADVDASTISYVETHGTGTPLGDPIEIDGLRQAFSISEEERTGPCYVGSVKSNIGHLESAAGIAALIKTILCLKNKAIPATLHYTSPNPELHLEKGPFRVRSEYGAWESDGARRAGVSAFGVGGTNAHVVLEEAPQQPAPFVTEDKPQVLLLSARTEDSLTQSRKALAEALSADDAPALPDVAYTLDRRRADDLRLVAVVKDRQEAPAVLGADDSEDVFVGQAVKAAASADRVVFLFPGQGAQHIGMARGLYDADPVFAKHFDECAEGFGKELGFDLRELLFEGSPRELERTDRTQPALFTVEYALAKLIEHYGVRPAAMAGHSIGEYVAATVAGVFDIQTAVQAVSMRARLMHAAPRGTMVAVPMGPDAVAEYLSTDVDLAAVNDPGGCVVAGSDEAIRDFQKRLQVAGVSARRVRTSHAFHSRLMEPALPEFTGFMSRLTLHEPTVPLLSNLTGTWLAPGEAINPSMWARQLRSTVRFADELGVLLSDPARVFVEIGPGGTLTGSAMRHPAWSSDHRAVRLMRHHAQNRGDVETFLLALGQLWAAGVDVDWSPQHGGRTPQLVSVPGYPFARQRHWVDYNQAAVRRPAGGAVADADDEEPAASSATRSGGTPMEDLLGRIWAQCLGVTSVDKNANFFELGGDSLVAISVAMAASQEGITITPQDLYENQTVAAMAKTVVARFAAGSLARRSTEDAARPPVPPNIADFLENGLTDAGTWRIPLILRLRSDIPVDDVRAVLTAITGHHDALRAEMIQHAGIWEQRIGAVEDFGDLPVQTLPDGSEPGSVQERDAVFAICQEQISAQTLAGPALTAVYVRGAADGPSYLALSLHAMVVDDAARDILLSDIFTAFGQQLAGEDIVLTQGPVSWTEWSRRAAALASHPAVLESLDFWTNRVAGADLTLTSDDAVGRPAAGDLVRLSSALSTAQTATVDGARRDTARSVEALLLAALSRTVATTVGEGRLAVEIGSTGRTVLQPDVDLRRTVGWFTNAYPVPLDCSTTERSGQLLEEVAEALDAVPHHGIGYGLLRYLYAPSARLLGATRRADVYVSYVGNIPELPPVSDAAAIQLDADIARSFREVTPGLGHPVELRVYRADGVLQADWWYDARRVDPAVVRALSEKFPDALLELIRDAATDDESDEADDFALVDLSSAEA